MRVYHVNHYITNTYILYTYVYTHNVYFNPTSSAPQVPIKLGTAVYIISVSQRYYFTIANYIRG